MVTKPEPGHPDSGNRGGNCVEVVFRALVQRGDISVGMWVGEGLHYRSQKSSDAGKHKEAF